MKLKEVINDIDTDVIHPLYYLKGNDYFLQDFFIERLSIKFFKNQNIDCTFLLPDEMSGKEIVDRIITTDLFSSKRLFIIRSPQKIKGKASADLLNICRVPIENNVLLLINDDWSHKSSFFIEIEKIVDSIDVQTPFANGLKKWAKYFLKKKGKTTSYRCEEFLVDMFGDSLGNLKNEIEKICLMIGDRKNITLDDIKSSSGWKRENMRWEFLLAIGRKDYSQSISLGKNIITRNETMSSLIVPLTALFQEILFFKMKKGTFRTNYSYIPIPPSVKKRIPEFSNKFSLEKISIALELLKKIDKRKKTKYSSDETELIQFIGSIIG